MTKKSSDYFCIYIPLVSNKKNLLNRLYFNYFKELLTYFYWTVVKSHNNIIIQHSVAR